MFDRIALPRLAACLLLCLPLVARADVFINEIHYDDSTGSGDQDESIEVVATGGEDLSTYSLVLYNGSGGITYDTQALGSGSSASCGATVQIAYFNFTANGGQVQNGAPDGVALVDSGNTVIQFLSYEGTFMATNGPANGLTSTDIGVSETNSTAAGTSLQLGGTSGTSYADFSWNGSATATFGACNNGQTFGAAVDNPPTVSSTTPTDMATGVAVDSALEVVFSEPVTATGAFSLSCTGAGSVTIDVTGGPSSYTLTPQSNLQFGDDCTLTIAAASVTDQDGTPDNMAGDVTVDFSTSVDNPPSVISVTPNNGAMNVGYFSNITVVFSEPVDVTGSWIALDCGSGPLPGSTSASMDLLSYTFDPTSSLPPSGNCSATVVATEVTDKDGIADAMTGDVNVMFTVAADTAPTLSSSYPGDGDVNVAIDVTLTLTFSEPVDIGMGGIGIDCVDTGSDSFALSSSDNITWTVNPDTDFGNNEDCTVTLTGSQITDQDGSVDALSGNPAIMFTTSAGAGDYYSGVDATTCTTLRTTLHDLIKGHTKYPYSASSTDTWDILDQADEDPLNSGNILDVYKNASYVKAGGGNSFYNREHTWPKTYGFSDTGVAGAATDTHMLHLADITYNSDRGSKPYADCTSGCTELATNNYNGQGGGGGGDSNYYVTAGSENLGSFEVWDHEKGDMARSVMYMAVRYMGDAGEPNLDLTDDRNLITSAGSGGINYMGLKSTLLAWNSADPPDSAEVLRNTLVQSYQGNRNPFIDHPEWAECVFTCACAATVAANDDSYPATEDTTLNVSAPGGVLNNDNATNPITSVVVNSGVSHGSLTLNNDGSFDYSPDANYCGTDSFIYQASDGSLNDTATVTLNIACQEDGPAPAQNDSLTVDEDSFGTVDVILNDGVDPDPEQNPLSIATAGSALHGGTSIVAGGIQYTPTANYCGGDSFDYTLSGGGSATVNVTVTCLNDPPVASSDSYPGSMDTPLVVSAPGVLGNDSDIDSGTLHAVLDIDVQHGSLALNDDGSFSYTPATGYCGADSFSYHANDGAVDSGSVTVSLDIACTATDIFQDGFE